MRARMALATLPLILLLWLGMGAFLWQKHSADLAAAAQGSSNLTHAFEENIRRTIEAIDTTIRAVRVARAHDPDRFDMAAWERDSGLTRELTLQLSMADRTGAIVASNLSSLTNAHANIADRAHFRSPRDSPGDMLFISDPVLGRLSKRWSVQFVRKLFDAAGAFDGVIVASLDPAFLSRFYTSLDVGHGALMLLGQGGTVRSAAPDGVVRLGADLSHSALLEAASAAAHGTMRTTGLDDGIERVVSWRRVEPYGLLVVVGLATADALHDYRRDLRVCIVIGLGVTLLILLVSTVLARHRRDVMLSQEMLRAAVDNISQGLMVVDAQRHVPVMNARVAELLDLPAHLTLPGFDFDSMLEWQLGAGEFNSPESQAVRTLAESGGLAGGYSVYQRTRGNGTVLEIRTKVLENGLAVRTFTDITEQERAAHVLADARDAAEAAARARSEFLAVMSHEIRTPLNGVIGVAGLLEDMELGPEQRDYVRLIRQSGDHLLELINDVLDFSRLEAQRVELEEVDFDPKALMHGVAEMFLTQADAKGLHLSVDTADTVPASVSGDPGRLRQILLNLVSNAVKFTSEGRVSLTLLCKPATEGRVRLLFSVTDSGVGIIPEAVERMFQEFTQMDSSISRRFGGSGLGLAICRRLVELMGGTITVESKPNEGSTFRFDVTLRLADTPVTEAVLGTGHPPGPNLRILLAEDNSTNRLVALRILERFGHRADAVGNGIEAITALQREYYDLILMDVMMPEMDGLAATRHIRSTESIGTHIAIVGLTAGSGIENLVACQEAGMDAVTTKPVTLARLQAAIAEGLANAAKAIVSPPSTAVPPTVGPPDDPRLAATEHPAATKRPSFANPRLHELAQMLGEDAVAEIVQAFAEDTRANLETMKSAATRGDSRTVHRSAHSVAGAARNVGADALAQRAAALEQTTGSMSLARITAEIEALFGDLDTASDALVTDAFTVTTE